MVALVPLIIGIVVVGFLVWLAETFIPMSPPIKTALRAVVVILLILWLLQVFGITGPSVKIR